jgi:hypothetical protein
MRGAPREAGEQNELVFTVRCYRDMNRMPCIAISGLTEFLRTALQLNGSFIDQCK